MPKIKIEKEAILFQNKFIKVGYDEERGTLNLFKRNSARAIIENAFSAVHTNEKICCSVDEDYRRCCQSKDINDKFGKGKLFVFLHYGAPEKPDLTVRMFTYEDAPHLFFQISVKNSLDRDINIIEFHPLSTALSKEGRLNLGGSPSILCHWKFFQNGYNETAEDVSIRRLHLGSFESHWFTTIKDPYTGNALTTGFVSMNRQMAKIKLRNYLFWDEENYAKEPEFDPVSLAEGLSLRPGEEMASEKLFLDFYSPPLKGLESYASSVQKEMNIATKKRLPTGWCSWYYFFKEITEKDIIKNLEHIRARKYPIEYIQIDDGWQKSRGDWEANEKFPHGMKWIADKIKEYGYKPGIWIAPFQVEEKSTLFKEHPEYLVKDAEGKPLPNIFWKNTYALDTTHPGAQKWLKQVFQKIVDDWGFEYIKLDFLFHAASKGYRYDKKVTTAQAYRKGLEIIREIAKDKYLLVCNGPCSEGIADSVRIAWDIGLSWSSVKIAARTVMAKYFMHNKFWHNDPDCLVIRDDSPLSRSVLSIDEVRFWTTVVALSGGAVMLGDNIPTLSEERAKLLDLVFPPQSKSAVPIDLFERDFPRVFSLETGKEEGTLRVVGIFNWEDEESSFTLNLSDLGLDDPDKKYHVYEYWEQKYYGILSKIIKLKNMRPHSTKLLIIRTRKFDKMIPSHLYDILKR